MSEHRTESRIEKLVAAEEGTLAVLQGNLAFAVGCVRCGIHVADGYAGTPSTEVIDKGLRFVQDRLRVGWSVNEANAVGLGFGATMAGADVVVTMKIPGSSRQPTWSRPWPRSRRPAAR